MTPLEDRAFLIAEIGPAIAAEAVWSLEPDTEAYREFQEGLRGLRHETEKLVMNPDIAAILGNNLWQRQSFALSALAILGNRMHASKTGLTIKEYCALETKYDFLKFLFYKTWVCDFK